MNGFLLDTNVLSEVRKQGSRCNEGVRRWYQAADTETLYLSVLVLGEIRKGIERIRQRDADSANAIETWMRKVSGEFGDRVLPVTANITNEWGKLGVDQPVPVVDGLLGATALVHELIFVTRNTVHLSRTGVQLLNPFT